jgi:hypothetical protein
MGDFINRQDERYVDGVADEELGQDLDDLIDATVNLVAKMLRPLADANKILYAHAGNHETKIEKKNSYKVARKICRLLNIPYMGMSCLFRLILSKGESKNIYSYDIYSHHGFGAGKYKGTSINSLMKLAEQFSADLYLMGHDHKTIATKSPELFLPHSFSTKKDDIPLRSKNRAFARCGTYMKTYLSGDNITYAEEKGYPPVNTGGITVEIRVKRRTINKRDIKELDVKVIE